MKKVTVVLPTYNEKENIGNFIADVLSQEEKLSGWTIELIIVDDIRTNDGTEDLVKTLSKTNRKIHYIKESPGLGVALIKGHQYALENLKPDILAQLDADGQVEVDVLPKLIQAIEEGYDLALGSRFVKGGKNKLSFSRRLFSMGSSLICRFIMGPLDVKEFANSARAFTPDLFRKINLTRLPWREKTFIIQPAFVNEAISAGAKYKEVPLVFKNRAEGYSKNKVINYTYDVITYAIDARLKKMGFNVAFFKITRRAKTFLKFGMVGVVGTLVDFMFYKIFINNFDIPPATSKAFSSEIAILNNFVFNHLWTFKHRKTKTNVWQKIAVFNLVSLGGLAIAVLIVKFLHLLYGDGYFLVFGLPIAYNNFYFFATIPPVLLWNFTMNHLVTWRHNKED